MSQYGTDENLAKRIAIHRFGVNARSWADWYFEHVEIRSGSRTLDIGCGNAHLWHGRESMIDASSSIVMADSSRGMLEAARRNLREPGGSRHFCLAAVECLPFDDDTFDTVMANHMLYHSTDVRVAISELARVVKPEGCVLASTIGRRHMEQLWDWMEESDLAKAAELRESARIFGLENGMKLLAERFEHVRLWRREDSLAVPAVDPVLDYVLSMQLSDAVENRMRLNDLRRRLSSELSRHGRIRIEKDTGLFEARDPVQNPDTA